MASTCVIAADTNNALRRLLQDDKAQASKANALFDRGHEILITDVVLAETACLPGQPQTAAFASPRL